MSILSLRVIFVDQLDVAVGPNLRRVKRRLRPFLRRESISDVRETASGAHPAQAWESKGLGWYSTAARVRILRSGQ